MAWFMLERNDTDKIVIKKNVYSFYTRIMVKDFEWGVLVKQGITTPLMTGRTTSLFKLPWETVQVYLGSTADFLVPFNISPYLSSFKVNIQGAIYAKVTDPICLIKNIDNFSDKTIHERVRNALEMSLISVVSHLQIPEIQEGMFQQPSNIASKIMYEMGLTPRYVTLSEVNMPGLVENALHNLAASYAEGGRIRNLSSALGKNSPMVNQQILQWENRGNISDFMNLLLLANVSGQGTALISPGTSQPQIQPKKQQQITPPISMVSAPADGNVCPVCNSTIDGKTEVLQCPKCKATFHGECARAYVRQTGKCPICKRRLKID